MWREGEGPSSSLFFAWRLECTWEKDGKTRLLQIQPQHSILNPTHPLPFPREQRAMVPLEGTMQVEAEAGQL